jgi:hypothetical protein
MFITNLKSSLGVLPWLLLPALVYVAFITAVDPWIQESGQALRNEADSLPDFSSGSSYEDEFFGEGPEYTDGFTEEFDGGFNDGFDDTSGAFRWTYSNECFGISTAAAIITGIVFLLVIPCALGGYDPGIKRGQFYLGFFIHLAVFVALPLVYFLVYKLDHTTFIILLALHAVSFMGSYIIGSRFVSPAYKKAFWFA